MYALRRDPRRPSSDAGLGRGAGKSGLGSVDSFCVAIAAFFAIAWIYREDYEQAGLKMLSVVGPTGIRIGRQIMIYTLGVHLLSFLPPVAGVTGHWYYLGALLLGIGFIASSFQTAFQLDSRSRSFFKTSVLYLALLLLLMLFDKTPL